MSGTDADAEPMLPLWHFGRSQSMFVGVLYYHASHSHRIPVFITAPYGCFGIRFQGEPWRSCRAAVVKAGTRYELDVGGEVIAVIHIEPTLGGVEALLPLLRDTQEALGAVVGVCEQNGMLRQLYEDRRAPAWIGSALDDMIGFAHHRARSQLDERIRRAVLRLQESYRDLPSVEAEALAASLSSSRFQHLFADAVGVPFRRYRQWCRVRGAIAHVVEGSSLTEAAHLAGFSDQAHFTHAFRSVFGAPPSRTLASIRRLGE